MGPFRPARSKRRVKGFTVDATVAASLAGGFVVPDQGVQEDQNEHGEQG